MTSLLAKKEAFTRNLIITAACELTDKLDISELSFKKISERAEISERTMFRYFNTRDSLLDALAERLHSQLELPAIPASSAQLGTYVTDLYRRLDTKQRTVLVLLHGEMFPRILNTSAKARLTELSELLAKDYPHQPQQEIIKTAANLRYVMSASSWRYYRHYFDFDLATSTECAKMLVSQALKHLA